ncbi:flagellar biosynthesis protein FliQ [Desulfosediminicola flagellatus]|uniref:flagellar biosynthesis protein FliQ n=1 Tax=Desulfosediminicola flagellatus TaxID=2569541 RepID=UPI0010AD52C6|nr:flagellar biosynthesis protein FliQ [Desulfosediminicola flagellatus]
MEIFTPDMAINVCRKAIQTILMVAGPMLIAGLLVGLLISTFQAATQINEQTMTFIPKIVAVFLTLLFFGPWIIRVITTFTIGVFETMGTL